MYLHPFSGRVADEEERNWDVSLLRTEEPDQRRAAQVPKEPAQEWPDNVNADPEREIPWPVNDEPNWGTSAPARELGRERAAWEVDEDIVIGVLMGTGDLWWGKNCWFCCYCTWCCTQPAAMLPFNMPCWPMEEDDKSEVATAAFSSLKTPCWQEKWKYCHSTEKTCLIQVYVRGWTYIFLRWNTRRKKCPVRKYFSGANRNIYVLCWKNKKTAVWWTKNYFYTAIFET